MTHPLAALLKDVPRYRLTGYDAGTQPDGAGDYVAYHEVLAALEVAHHVNETPKSEHDGADVLTALPADVAGVVEEAGKVLEGTTPGPWMYRPNKYDDWGVVKADDFHLCQVRDPNCYMTEDLDAARAAKVDPWETNARFIAWCREGVPALLAQNAALRANTVQALDEKDREYNRLTNDMIERHAAQIAGLTKERDDALHFLDVAVSKSPEPLKALGSHLAALLDEDDWPTAERFLNGAVAKAATLRAEVERLRGALQWCSGSDDFQDGGKAREGWLKLCAPLLHGEGKA